MHVVSPVLLASTASGYSDDWLFTPPQLSERLAKTRSPSMRRVRCGSSHHVPPLASIGTHSATVTARSPPERSITVHDEPHPARGPFIGFATSSSFAAAS